MSRHRGFSNRFIKPTNENWDQSRLELASNCETNSNYARAVSVCVENVIRMPLQYPMDHVPILINHNNSSEEIVRIDLSYN